MNKNNRSLKTIFAEALEHYRKRDLKTAEIVCYKILSIDPEKFNFFDIQSKKKSPQLQKKHAGFSCVLWGHWSDIYPDAPNT